jgi:hypothetical protein
MRALPRASPVDTHLRIEPAPPRGWSALLGRRPPAVALFNESVEVTLDIVCTAKYPVYDARDADRT